MKALILYSTRDGQTQKIASALAETIRQQQPCDVLNIQDAAVPDWTQYDRVLIGASIRYGHFQPVVETTSPCAAAAYQRFLFGKPHGTQT